MWHCFDSVATVLWQCCDSIVTVSWQCCDSVVTVLWQCSDCIVKVFWWCCDSVVTVLWKCCGSVVTVLWQCCDSIVTVLWQCCDSVVTVLWQCCDRVITMLWQCCNVNFEWDMTENCWYSAEKSLVGGRGHLITVSLLLRLLLWNFWLLNNLDLDFDQDMTWTRNVLDWTGPDLDWTWTWSLTILLFINNLSYNIPNSTHAYDIGEISFYFGTSLQYFSLWIAEFVWCHLWVQTLKKSFRTTEMHLKISRSWMRRSVEFQRLWKSTLFSDHHCAYFTEYGITMASTNDEIVETAYQVVAKRDQTKQ